ncbi:hypothetical protein IMZ48_32240 [Candidatus Bathyarchaeota archaeon]|nr:hypothetical protein [Candidatus Bathyarchaeota archaeon]
MSRSPDHLDWALAVPGMIAVSVVFDYSRRTEGRPAIPRAQHQNSQLTRRCPLRSKWHPALDNLSWDAQGRETRL